MQNPWLYIGLFLIIGIVVPVAPLVIAAFLAPRKPNPIKQSTYECGMETVGESWVQFKAQYYVFALVFLVFDVETVFIFPWGVVMREVGLRAFVEILIFFVILGLGLLYAWRKDALRWV